MSPASSPRGTRVREVPADSIELEEGTKYFINIGSVGQPRDLDWRACYVVYDVESKLVNFRRIEYDLETTQRKILEAGLPPSLAERLADGRLRSSAHRTPVTQAARQTSSQTLRSAAASSRSRIASGSNQATSSCSSARGTPISTTQRNGRRRIESSS